MAKKKSKAKPIARAPIVVPLELKNDFRKTCTNLDLKPSLVIQRIMRTWIEKKRKKVTEALVSNG